MTKYHFLLGQASFYFIALALLSGNFRLSRQTIIWFGIFLTYCLGSAALMCVTETSLCTSRPYTAALSILFVFLAVEYVAYCVENNSGFECAIEYYIVFGAWVLVILSIPDVYHLIKTSPVNAMPLGWDFLSVFKLPTYDAPRLRGLTQEPSYLGMVIATLYPICFIRLNQKYTFNKLLLVLGLWTCLIFSMSRTGLLSCFILTFVILLIWPKRLFMGIFVFTLLVFVWSRFSQLFNKPDLGLSWYSFFGLTWLPSYADPGMGNSLPRLAHVLATLKAWWVNPLFGVGLGQLGYVLPEYYPDWYTTSSREYASWVGSQAKGGVPSFSFVPKLLAEIGLLGVILLNYGVFSRFNHYKSLLKESWAAKKYFFAFFGFVLASFGVEGYLYLPAWLVFGVLLGLSRIKSNHTP